MGDRDVNKLGTFEQRERYSDGSFSRGIHICADNGEISRGFHEDIALGYIDGFSSEFKFGANPDLGIVEEVIWYYGGNYPFLPFGTAETLSVVSTSSLDANGNTGAWNLLIIGLDANGLIQTETIALAGLTPVITTKAFFRVNRCLVLQSGTATATQDANQGVITITTTTSAYVQGQIGIHNGITTQAVYTVPADKNAYVTGVSFNVGQGKECKFYAKSRNCAVDNCAFTVKYAQMIYQNTFNGNLETPLKLDPLTDIVITGKLSSTPNVYAYASFGMYLKDI